MVVIVTGGLLMILPHSSVLADDDVNFEFNCPNTEVSPVCCGYIFRNNLNSGIIYDLTTKTCKFTGTSSDLTPINSEFQECCKKGGTIPEKAPAAKDPSEDTTSGTIETSPEKSPSEAPVKNPVQASSGQDTEQIPEHQPLVQKE
ncbi:hypothetical protein BDA99DRAFT_527538 [Phascolomyces articulosus]|uniref:Uncharacterized protein n=1 Tax=Phascolomyces articulosus TaxID=60185 RepID=A0AAD5JXR5_9FUNG|nr:hypothetical protein BDA99DRAFT_527538 [Phascolomyces articulosus]